MPNARCRQLTARELFCGQGAPGKALLRPRRSTRGSKELGALLSKGQSAPAPAARDVAAVQAAAAAT
eukprot:4194142-Pleurochrysis_carterae.AAC.1